MRNFLLILSSFTFYLSADLKVSLDQELKTLMPKVIEWRHDIHQHPELGNKSETEIVMGGRTERRAKRRAWERLHGTLF